MMGVFWRIPLAFGPKGLAIHALYCLGIGLMCPNLDAVQGAIVLLAAVITTRLNGAADGLVAFFILHVCPSLPRLRQR